MDVAYALEELTASEHGPSALTIGNFDGVHLGHKLLLQRTVEAAKHKSLRPAALTFWPHPQATLTKRPPRLISTLEQRLTWIKAEGIRQLVIQTFDDSFSRIEAERFLDLLVDHLGIRHLVLGYDFRFGYRGRGTVDLAQRWAENQTPEVEVETVAPLRVADTGVSSSHIRRKLKDGDVETATQLLGRPWQITGRVVSGAGRGKTLGYPTVNIDTENPLICADGVYGGRIWLDGEGPWIAAISVGTNPTFGDEPRHAEAFLLDFDGDEIQGDLTLEFLSYIRAQITFHDAAKLIAQIEQDVALIHRQAERNHWLDKLQDESR